MYCIHTVDLRRLLLEPGGGCGEDLLAAVACASFMSGQTNTLERVWQLQAVMNGRVGTVSVKRLSDGPQTMVSASVSGAYYQNHTPHKNDFNR